MSFFPPAVDEKAQRVIQILAAKNLMVATAESCTGGLIAAALTDVAGSSAVVDRGFVTYSNNAKMDMLGVAPSTLESYGAVSEETAREMVRGALTRSQAHLAVAVTGIAGPGGGSADKPVGLVHLAAQSRNGRILHSRMLYGNIGREPVRLATVETALQIILDLA